MMTTEMTVDDCDAVKKEAANHEESRDLFCNVSNFDPIYVLFDFPSPWKLSTVCKITHSPNLEKNCIGSSTQLSMKKSSTNVQSNVKLKQKYFEVGKC